MFSYFGRCVPKPKRREKRPPPQVVRCQAVDTRSPGAPFHYIPDRVYGYSRFLSEAVLSKPPEHPAFIYPSTFQPDVDEGFAPRRHRHGSHSTCLPGQIDYDPVALSEL